MANILDSILNFRLQKKHAEYKQKEANWRTVLWQSVRENKGLKVDKPIGAEVGSQLLEDAPENIDVHKTAELIGRRMDQYEIAKQLDSLKARDDAAEQALREFEEQDREYQRTVKEKRIAFGLAAHTARQSCLQAIQAREDLIATAAIHPDEAALAERLTEVSRAIDRCNIELSTGRLSGVSLIARADSCRNQLYIWVDNNGKYERKPMPRLDDKRHAELEGQLAQLESEIEHTKKELAKLTKEREVIHAKLAKLVDEKLKPENFAIIRRNPATSAAQSLIGSLV